MKKTVKKLHLHRETLRGLEPQALLKAQGGDEWTGCLSQCTACKGDRTADPYSVVQ